MATFGSYTPYGGKASMPLYGSASDADSGSVGGIRTAIGGAPKTKTAYTINGQPVEIDASIPTTNYDPNTGYAGTHYFNAPPSIAPQPRLAEATAGQAEANVDYTQQQTQQITPSVAPLVGNAQNSLVTQGAYEGQAQTQLEADLAAKAATGDLQAQKDLLELRSRLNDEAFSKRLALIGRPVTGDPGSTGGNMYQPTFDEEGARAAAFGRAKDQAGKTALASLQALQDVMAGRGLRGSTIEGDATADVIGGAGGEVNEFTREQLIQDLNRAAQISDRESSAALTRRGQDLNYNQSLLGLLQASGGLY